VNKKIPNVVVVPILTGILVAIVCWVYFGDTSVSQARRMRIAREFLPVITSAVHSHQEFHDVTTGVGTGAGGCLVIYGVVESERRRTELQNIIAATKPPVTVTYAIKVLAGDSNVKP
jgi:hypothetical protein